MGGCGGGGSVGRGSVGGGGGKKSNPNQYEYCMVCIIKNMSLEVGLPSIPNTHSHKDVISIINM